MPIRPRQHNEERRAMTGSPLGKTLVVANPAARSGEGERAAAFAEKFFGAYAAATKGFEVVRTTCAGEGVSLASDSAGFNTVIALGGDGVIHEVVCGLMMLPQDRRPQLGVVPMGSGNDYARTLGIKRNDVGEALSQLVRGHAKPCDVGKVNSTYFMQTLSFGLDAAIALDTTEKRVAGTSQKGEELFVRSALRILSHASEGFDCEASFDGEEAVRLSSIILAVQVGPSYGGGFKICPEADPCDGALDVCLNVKLPPLPHLLALLGLARIGRHTASSVIETRRIRHAELSFAEQPPCQVDGEKLEGKGFSIDVVPQALNVIFPKGQ